LLEAESRRLAGVLQHGHHHFAEEAAAPLDQIQMAQGQRIKAAGIEGTHAWRLASQDLMKMRSGWFLTSPSVRSPLLMQSERLERRLKEIPAQPGCYLMRDQDDRILYVGKSKSLRSRVRSYFRSRHDLSPRIRLMTRQVCEIEFIVTVAEGRQEIPLPVHHLE
jgi:hypothetical protein